MPIDWVSFKFMEIEPSAKFYGDLSIFLKVIKLLNLERFRVSDAIPSAQLFTMYWNKSLIDSRA